MRWLQSVNKSLLIIFVRGGRQLVRVLYTLTRILGYADFTKPFVVETDACFDGLGVVLSQEQGVRRVICICKSYSSDPMSAT